MISKIHIQKILALNKGPLGLEKLLDKLKRLVSTNYEITESDVRYITLKSPTIFEVSDEFVISLKAGAETDDSHNDFEIMLIDGYLSQLYDILRDSGVDNQIEHFVSLVLYDRISNNHFHRSSEVDRLANKRNHTLIYTAVNYITEYSKTLKEFNRLHFLHNVFENVLHELEQKDSIGLKRLYSALFNKCMEFQQHRFDPIVFGRAFNKFLTERAVNFYQMGQFPQPEILGRLIAEHAAVKSNESVYMPYCGIGSFFVELAHSSTNYTFHAVGVEPNDYFQNIAKVNLLLNGIENIEILQEDPLFEEKIPNNSIDLAISGARVGKVTTTYSKGFFHNWYLNNKSLDSNYAVLNSLLAKTKVNGRILQVVSDGALTTRIHQEHRKDIVTSSFVQRVISVPHGIYYPHSGMAVSLVVLNKGKLGANKVVFVDARQALKLSLQDKRQGLKNDQIEAFVNDTTLSFNPPETEEFRPLIPTSVVDLREIAENDYALLSNKYCNKILSEINKAKREGVNFFKLGDIAEIIQGNAAKPLQKSKAEMVIKISDLSGAGEEVDYKNLSRFTKNQNITNGSKILNEAAILVAKVGKHLKPTIFKPLLEPVIIHPNIFPLRIVNEGILPEYLVAQLGSEMVKEQLEGARVSTGIPHISKELLFSIQIPLLSLAEQLEWVAKHRRQSLEADELTSFIKSIPLIESSSDLKKEIERFAQQQFNSPEPAEYLRYFQYEKFPFSAAEMDQQVLAKKIQKNKTTLILLQNREYGMFGVIKVSDQNPIDFAKVNKVNEYAAFLMKIYDFLTKSSINRQLDSFAHTSRNFFFKLQGAVTAILDSKNAEFQHVLETSYVEPEESISYFERKGTKDRSDFLLKNQLLSVKDQIKAQYDFYDQIHILYSEIKNSQTEAFAIRSVIEEVKGIIRSGVETNNLPNGMIVGKRALIKHALLDLIGNAIQYSSKGKCFVDVLDKRNSFEISILNDISETMPEDRYNQLGQTWLKDNADGHDRISSGIYYAFQMIRESFGEVSLIDYATYQKNKEFKVIIKLRKE